MIFLCEFGLYPLINKKSHDNWISKDCFVTIFSGKKRVPQNLCQCI